MSYKTILVHLNDMRRTEAMLEPVIQLATRYNSHLKGLHVDTIMAAPPLAFTYATSGLGPAAAEERTNGEAIAAIFARMTATGACVAEWQQLKVPQGDLVAVVLEHGRTADLIVAGQVNPDSRAPRAGKRPSRSGHSLCPLLSEDGPQRRDRLEGGGSRPRARSSMRFPCSRVQRMCMFSRSSDAPTKNPSAPTPRWPHP